MRRGEPGPFYNDYHLPGCQWIAAVLKIYELERAEEANAANSPGQRT